MMDFRNPAAMAVDFGGYPILQFASAADRDAYPNPVDGQQAYVAGEGMRQEYSRTLGRWMPGNVSEVYNETKERWERWERSCQGDLEWMLENVAPGRRWQDTFVPAPGFVAAVLGLNAELSWAVNGRRNGANDPDVNCFTAANEMGGGLSVNVIAGGLDNDYSAIHWGANYPTKLSKSPHWFLCASLRQNTQMAYLLGLTDDSRSDANAAFALPDNGIFYYFDTDVDNLRHMIVRSNGVTVTEMTAVTPGIDEFATGTIETSDDGLSMRFVFKGSIVLPWTDISGAAYANLRAAQLQPYLALVNRAPNQLREFAVCDFRLIMDAGH